MVTEVISKSTVPPILLQSYSEKVTTNTDIVSGNLDKKQTSYTHKYTYWIYRYI